MVTNICHVLFQLSLGILVPNSKDQHEQKWQPNFMHHRTHPNTLCLRTADWNVLLTLLITLHLRISTK